jgi:predicted secreted protein
MPFTIVEKKSYGFKASGYFLMSLYLHHVDLQGSINEQKKNLENCRNMHFSPKYAQGASNMQNMHF